MTSVHALSWHDNVRACSLTVFVPYLLHQLRLTLSFYYWWICHLSVLTSYHLLSLENLCVRLVTLFLFYLCLNSVLCIFSFSLHSGFDLLSFFIHAVFDYFFVWSNFNYISNILNPKILGLNIPWSYFQLEHTKYQAGVVNFHIGEYACTGTLHWIQDFMMCWV